MSAVILHLTARSDWQAAQAAGAYTAPSLESEGFIHCSTGTQIASVANRFYAGRHGLVVLVIDPARLRAELRWEPPAHPGPVEAAATGELFPHVYGPIDLQAVVRVIDWEPGPDGTFTLPTALETEI